MAGLLCASTILPAAADSTADQLQQLRAQEASQRSQLSQLTSQKQAVRVSLGKLRANVTARQADLADISQQLEALRAQVGDFEAQEKALVGRHDERVRAYLEATRTTYKEGTWDWMAFILNSGSFSDFLDRLAYSAALARHEIRQAHLMADERDRLASQRQQTELLKAQLDPLIRELGARLANAQAAASSQATVVSAIEHEQRAALAAVQGLQQREKQLENALAAAQAASAAAVAKGPARTFASQCPAAPAGMLSFCGHGFGHGVGMGQYGALGMAEAGIGWPRILSSFYTGTSLSGFPAQTVRVYLTAGESRLTPRLAGASLYDSGGNNLAHVAADTAVQFTRTASGDVGCSACGARVGHWIRLVPDAGGTFQAGGGARYRGYGLVDGSSGLKVINHVDLEDYLRGLGEVPSTWPIDAIEAQTVAARTYALAHLRPDGLFDVDDTTRYQVYRGLEAESPGQNAAVAGTRGQAIFFQGQLIDAVFSSSDGGHSECASAEWGQGDSPCSPAYLQGVPDDYDAPANTRNPYHTWYTPPHRISELQGYLVTGHVYNPAQCGTLDHFGFTRDQSDRVRQVQMVGTRGTCTASAGTFISGINAGSPSDFAVYGEMFGATPGSGAWPYF